MTNKHELGDDGYSKELDRMLDCWEKESEARRNAAENKRRKEVQRYE